MTNVIKSDVSSQGTLCKCVHDCLHLYEPVSMLTIHRGRKVVVDLRGDSNEEATRGRAGRGKAGQGLGRVLGPKIHINIHINSHLKCVPCPNRDNIQGCARHWAQDTHMQSPLKCIPCPRNTQKSGDRVYVSVCKPHPPVTYKSQVAEYTSQSASLTNIVYQSFDVSSPIANLAAQIQHQLF